MTNMQHVHVRVSFWWQHVIDGPAEHSITSLQKFNMLICCPDACIFVSQICVKHYGVCLDGCFFGGWHRLAK